MLAERHQTAPTDYARRKTLPAVLPDIPLRRGYLVPPDRPAALAETCPGAGLKTSRPAGHHDSWVSPGVWHLSRMPAL